MTRNNPYTTIAEKAGEYFFNGYHCAESVVAAACDVLPQIDTHKRETALTCSTCFGGGFGKSFDEACGVISGALIVLGLLYGRSKQGKSWDTPADLTALFREAFLRKHKTTHCGQLRERFGDENQMIECQKLVCEGTAELLQLIKEHEEQKNGRR
ncbi:C-GCAxxG-C-C family protein [Desulfopila sp. IMCC35008]|uniref:C-GCAxxG-C-C family protein n=1 Tax=Desulfopila sp. IMCC35008 TaxID=2653858 RepID=UPI0013D083B5|nr:C-GCAxxG-C-C family protein [Desulfopila sp. IMCC35008]